ncbi:Methyltransferase-like protein 22 [Podila horticola]|nr:Methyltransferase-like protein 22 [Podila horticola]
MQDQDQDQEQDRPCKRPRHEPHHQQQEPQSDEETPNHLNDHSTDSDTPLSPQASILGDESDQDPEDDIVLSDVHIHPDNGRVDGRVMISTFLLSTVNQNAAKDDQETQETQEASDEGEDNDDPSWDHELHIQHAMGTSLRNVGSQVWMGCFLLTDYMVELGSLLDGCVALELGAGTGISSIASGILTNVRKTFCTDFDTDVLSNCRHNVYLNSSSIKPENKIVTRRLNWFPPCPMETVEGEDEDEYSWTPEDVREWTDEGAFVFAADGSVKE